MARRHSEHITWGDTPLARIANRTSAADVLDFLENTQNSGDLPKPDNRVSFRRMSSNTPAQRWYQRRMSAPSVIQNTMFLNEIQGGNNGVRKVSWSETSTEDAIPEVIQENEDVIPGKEQDDQGFDVLKNCSEKIFRIQNSLKAFIHRRHKLLKRLLMFCFLILYAAYFGYAMYFRFGDEGSVRLLTCTIFGVVILLLNVISNYVWIAVQSANRWQHRPLFEKIVRWTFYIIASVGIVLSLIFLVALRNPRHLLSLPGLAVFILFTYITSANPTKVQWHPVFWGLSIQYLCGVLILHMDWGVTVSKYIGDRITEFLDNTEEGAKYVFGESLHDHHFAFSVLSVTVFFSTVVSVLYHFEIMQSIIRVLGRTLSFCFRTSPVEALNLAGNIFIGFTEAPLMIRPFLPVMTHSELHTVMTAGFATVAGNVLTVYAAFGVPVRHLLAACIMSAPAALAISKLSYPETEKTKSTLEDYLRLEGRPCKNVIESVTNGATSSVKLVASVIVNVMAFICIFRFLDSTLMWFGDRVGIESLSFELICTYLLYPIALFMGVDPSDCRPVARMVGLKIFTNEVYAYGTLSKFFDNRAVFENYTISNNNTEWFYDGDDIVLSSWNNRTLVGGVISQRSEVITTYALCGFSNIGSIGIMLGILGALAPQKKLVLTQIVIRALAAGNIACFITACTAGLLYKET